MELEGKRVAILGLGIEGAALLEFLKNRAGSVAIHDKDSAEKILDKVEGELKEQIQNILVDESITKVFGKEYLDNLEKYDIIFRSPAVYFNDPALIKAKAHGVAISSQMKLFFALCPCPIIGVTGTKGKGTTSSLIFSILENNAKFLISNSKSNPKSQIPNPKIYLAGNIGKPAISLISELKKNDTVILELSNFQLADLDRSPHVAVVTNLGVDHLDYHKDVAEYRAAKKNIVLWQGRDDFAVLNHKSTFSPATVKSLRSQIEYFSSDNSYVDCAVLDEYGISKVILDPQDRNLEICKISDLNIIGRHNLENVAAAALVADILHVPVEVIREAVKRFTGLPHRLELVVEINKVKYINDSFATNPDPTMAAINSFDQDKIVILGGSSKGADFSGLAEMIVSANVKSVILIGVEAPKIKAALKLVDYHGRIVNGGNSIESIVNKAMVEAKKGDVVIFSPACASFDMFKNYKERGEKFKEAVLKLT